MARAGATTIATPDGPAELPKDHGVVVSFPASHMELDVDDWGHDVHAVRRAARLAAVRWSPILGGLEHCRAAKARRRSSATPGTSHSAHCS